jgi:predicted membrane-bound mannosyltransferase
VEGYIRPAVVPLNLSRSRIALVIVLLTIAAALPRVWRLGSFSFYGDEDTYYRELPLTALYAVAARVTGPESDAGYRIPAAVFGALSVGLLCFAGRPLVGVAAATAAAGRLAITEWPHVF